MEEKIYSLCDNCAYAEKRSYLGKTVFVCSILENFVFCTVCPFYADFKDTESEDIQKFIVLSENEKKAMERIYEKEKF